jgi:hypothetical protein
MRLPHRLVVSASLTVALLVPGSAAATVTIGQLAPASPPAANCNQGPQDLAQISAVTGAPYVVPDNAVSMTSWSTNAAAAPGQMFEMKLFRNLGTPASWMVVAHDGPHPLTPGVVNTFPVDIAVHPGDVLGLNTVNANSVPNACTFSAPQDDFATNPGDLADGASANFQLVSLGGRGNVSAALRVHPSNDFRLGSVRHNQARGSAGIEVNVPGPGTIALYGNGIKTQPGLTGRAVASRVVSGSGTVRMKVRPKPATKRKLRRRGTTHVTAHVVYIPSGDFPGVPNSQTRTIVLTKN